MNKNFDIIFDEIKNKIDEVNKKINELPNFIESFLKRWKEITVQYPFNKRISLPNSDYEIYISFGSDMLYIKKAGKPFTLNAQDLDLETLVHVASHIPYILEKAIESIESSNQTLDKLLEFYEKFKAGN